MLANAFFPPASFYLAKTGWSPTRSTARLLPASRPRSLTRATSTASKFSSNGKAMRRRRLRERDAACNRAASSVATTVLFLGFDFGLLSTHTLLYLVKLAYIFI